MLLAIFCQHLQILFVVKHVDTLKIKRQIIACGLLITMRGRELVMKRIKIMLQMLCCKILQNFRIINIAKAVGCLGNIVLQIGKHLGNMRRTLFEAFIFFGNAAKIKIMCLLMDKHNFIQSNVRNMVKLA